MIYFLLALLMFGIGALDINPFVDWLDEKNFPMAVKSAIMIATLGAIPAVLIGVTVIGDTFWGKRSR